MFSPFAPFVMFHLLILHSCCIVFTLKNSYVYSDAAQYIHDGYSPYKRTTYRYTPFLAYFLSLFIPHREIGRYIFCIADTICGYIIIKYRQRIRDNNNHNNNDTKHSTHDQLQRLRFEDAMWWLYNPLAINICTRGSAESLVVLLPVLLTVWITSTLRQQPQQQPQQQQVIQKRHLYMAAILAGICHGLAIHAKLYPIIYTLSYMTQFITDSTLRPSQRLHDGNFYRNAIEIIQVWVSRLLQPAPILFGIITVLTFVTITYSAVVLYGNDALQEGLIYHFSRLDHRHNYSMHWYWIYLLRDRIVNSTGTINGDYSTSNPELISKAIGYILLFPQFILLLYTSLGVAPYSLSLALFVQTFLFVAHNKVITAQYFAWYLCLLPLCSDQFRCTKRVQYALLLLGLSIVIWLSSAYCLEMQGMGIHQIVWMASVFFFTANVNLLGALLSTTADLQRKRNIGKFKVN
jgi:GPI mannosyltransferase 1 subunit M